MSEPGSKKQATDAEIVAAIKEVIRETDAPVAKTAEISETLGVIGQQGCRDRLRKMDEEGIVESKRIGSGKAWWIA